MPWCEACSKYLTPSAMNADGTCPTCGRPVADGEQSGLARSTDASVDASDDERTPWHFKLLVVMLVVYLGWRFVQLLT